MSTKRLICYALGAAPLVAAALLATAGPAAAHVTVQPGEATKGGYAKIAFRVPNESDTAGTIKLEVTFPAEAPIASVRTKPTAGWTAERRTEKLATPIESHGNEITEAVRTVAWTAQPGVKIGPGEFTEFEVSVGPLPDNVDRLVLPAVQTYDDGEVVRWEEPPPAEGGEEPEHPAPVLRLVAEQNEANPVARQTDQPAPADTGPSTQAAGRDEAARWLGGAGLAVGALGLGLGIGGVLAGRRRARVE